MSTPRLGDRFTDSEGRSWRVTGERNRRQPVARLHTGRRPTSPITDEHGRTWVPVNLTGIVGRPEVSLEPDRTIVEFTVRQPLLYQGRERVPGEMVRAEAWTVDLDRMAERGLIEPQGASS